MKRFQESAAGRFLIAAVVLPLATGTSATWSPEGSGMMWIIASIFAGIILALVGIGLAVGEFDREAAAAILFLPPALLLYIPLVGLAASAPVVRVAMGLVAGTLLAVAWHDFVPLRFTSSRHATTH